MITEVVKIKTLRTLSLHGRGVTDDAMEAIGGCRGLEGLYLSATPITDDGLRFVRKLTELRVLHLGGATKVTDAGLKHLAPLGKLEELDVTHTRVTDKGLPELAALKSLRILDLWGTDVSDAGIPDLIALKQMYFLTVNKTKVTAEGVRRLRAAFPKGLVSGPSK